MNVNKHIYDYMTFSNLLATPLTTTHVKVLATIKENDFIQYPPHIKCGSNTRNPNKLCLFHHTKKCHALKKKPNK